MSAYVRRPTGNRTSHSGSRGRNARTSRACARAARFQGLRSFEARLQGAAKNRERVRLRLRLGLAGLDLRLRARGSHAQGTHLLEQVAQLGQTCMLGAQPSRGTRLDPFEVRQGRIGQVVGPPAGSPPRSPPHRGARVSARRAAAGGRYGRSRLVRGPSWCPRSPTDDRDRGAHIRTVPAAVDDPMVPNARPAPLGMIGAQYPRGNGRFRIGSAAADGRAAERRQRDHGRRHP